ncbi:type I secretion system permease/ATPase [Sulfurimonas sp.]|jgi:ATP-binding cassette subfamily C protein LapB|uniref:type I secretion system permease/ATPase n=1 Tax=Sulfurimonas sp. TaxID=2022749 RepID=UPI0025EDDB2A|nr:type I secretion system permease/ATPase [Sulfurimonas sp.]MBT5935331.1 type I secretion system permease/ATPase [Sulfurimonas sp.]
MKKNKKNDPLLECLVLLSKLENRPTSVATLIAGLPLKEGESSPSLFDAKTSKSLFTRAASRAGFSAKLVQRELDDISELVLPVILVLKNRGACVLEAIDYEKGEAKIILDELDEGDILVSLEVLKKEYIGFCYYIKKLHKFEQKQRKRVNTAKKHWFFDSLKISKKIYRDVIIASFIINLFVLAAPLFTMNVYDRVVPNSAIETMWVLAIGILVVYILDLILKLLRTQLLELAGKKSDIIISSLLFEKVMNLKLIQTPKSVGSFANNLKEFETIRNFLTSATLASIIDLPFVILFIAVTYSIGGTLVFVPLSVLVLILLYSWIVKKPLKRSIEATYEASAYKSGVLIESLINLETIKVLGASGHAQWKWEESNADIAQKGFASKILSASIGSVTAFMVQLNTVVILIVGVYMIEQMNLTMGGLIASVILSSRIIQPMGQIASLLSNYEHTKTAYIALDEIMKLEEERPESQEFIHSETLGGNIEFKDVCFSYGEGENNALKGINLSIKEGEKVAIIGKIGSGKSTLAKILLKLYEPTSGAVLFDNIDLAQIDPSKLRKEINYVAQESVLFNDTLRANILYKKANSDNEALVNAAHIGLVSEFINKHPKGFDMSIGEQGRGLSGGQRQSVSIARAFIGEAPIILLDEPSSSMDNSSEVLLLQRLKVASEGKTTILMTHKQSMLSLVDRVIVMDEGRIVLDGKKEDILKKLQGGNNA